MNESMPLAHVEPWRVVVVTNMPGGLIYKLVDGVMRSLGHKVVGVLTSPGPKRRRSASYLEVVAAVSPGVDVIVSNHPSRWAAMLAPSQPDLIVCGAMPWLLPREVIDLPRFGAINMHPAPLPKYRGPCAVEWAFRNDDSHAALTIHRMDGDFDTGPILVQTLVPIDDDDDLDSLLPKFGPLVPGLLQQAIARVARGELGEPQNEAEASYAGFFEDEWRMIDWTSPARTIHNQVRSWTGFRNTLKGALGQIDGQLVQVIKTSLAISEPIVVAGAEPGRSCNGVTRRWLCSAAMDRLKFDPGILPASLRVEDEL